MIPFAQVQLAARRADEAFIAAQPCSARFRRAGGLPALVLTVRTAEPQKLREMKQGGFGAGLAADLECWLVLPLTATRPEPALEFLDILDTDGDWRAYNLVTVTPTRGTACYRLGLKLRSDRPKLDAPPPPQ